MARCGCVGSDSCACFVVAGTGTTVTGSGAVGDPYTVSASVACADVRGCISAGDGVTYDSVTGVIAAQISTDAGNTTTIGGDGGLFTPGGGSTVVQAADTPSVDTTVTGTGTAGDPYVVSADVVVDATPPGGGTNLLHSNADGLYVECADVRTCFTEGDGIDYDPVTGVIAARLSADAGNTTTIGGDGGLFTPGGGSTVVQAADTPSVDTTVAGTGTAGDPYVVSSAVILDPVPPGGGANLLEVGPDGLYVECADVRTCFTEGDGIDYDPVTGVIAARLSADAGNTTTIGGDGGLYSAGTGVTVTDTDTIDHTLTGTGAAGDPYVLSSAVRLDATPPGGGTNLLQSNADGLYVECAQVRTCLTAGDGASYTAGTGEIEARLSADAGNLLSFGTDTGLLATVETGCGLQGDGTAASPLVAFPVAGSRAWSTDWDCNDAANSTLRCDPGTGALWTPPEHTSAAVTLQQNHPMGTPSFGVTGGFIIINAGIFSEGTYTADSLSVCRGISFSTRFTGHAEVSWTLNATFDLGYAVQINGGGLAVRQTHSILAAGLAGRERWSFGLSQAAVLAPHTGYTVRVFPAIQVTAGTVTIQQWITDTDLIAMTR